jgi:hypothetical protein
MEYRFIPAKINPNIAPTLVILHGHGNYPPARAEYDDWNVFNPLDNFGKDGLGSWWLGEESNFFTIKLFDKALNSALNSINQTIASAKLFMYGSSMGGYGVLLHGSRIGAIAVYANVPQIKLLHSTYSNLGMKEYFSPIFNGDSEYNNLVNILSKSENHPLYFICENRYGQKNYLNEQCMSIINFFNNTGINYYLEIIPTKGHKKIFVFPKSKNYLRNIVLKIQLKLPIPYSIIH